MRASVRCAAPSRPAVAPARRAPVVRASLPALARTHIVAQPRMAPFARLALPTAAFRTVSVARAAQGTSAPKAPAAKPQAAAAAGSAPDPVQDRISKDVKSDRVVLYMKGTPEQPMCGYSRLVVTILQQESAYLSVSRFCVPLIRSRGSFQRIQRLGGS